MVSTYKRIILGTLAAASLAACGRNITQSAVSDSDLARAQEAASQAFGEQQDTSTTGPLEIDDATATRLKNCLTKTGYPIMSAPDYTGWDDFRPGYAQLMISRPPHSAIFIYEIDASGKGTIKPSADADVFMAENNLALPPKKAVYKCLLPQRAPG